MPIAIGLAMQFSFGSAGKLRAIGLGRNDKQWLFSVMTHKLFILAYEGCQLLDVSGAAAVFGAANEGAGPPVYDLQIVSADGGLVTSSCGVALQSKKIGAQPDTLLVAGGSRGLKKAMTHEAT